MCGAVLTEPASPGAHAGVLFMDAEGFSPMSDRGLIAVATIALERGLIVAGGDGNTLILDTPAGTVRVIASRGPDGAIALVTFYNVPSFVMQPGVEIVTGTRRARADIAYGGAIYAIVDGESVGVPLDSNHTPELVRVGAEIRTALDRAVTVTHPSDPGMSGIHGVVFTGPPRSSSADLRNATVYASGAVDRSASGTATSAVMSVIAAMGLLDDDRPFVHESMLGTTLSGRVAGRTAVGDYLAIIPEIQGSAWITGEHVFIVDDDDPLRDGFAV